MAVQTLPALPFTFPRTGRMQLTADEAGNITVVFTYPNGHGAMVCKSAGDHHFRLVALDAAGDLEYLPQVLGEGVLTVRYLTVGEVDVLLTRISGLPDRA